jgi:hemerythrin-like domain-containing protein
LWRHIHKENEILFPMARQLLSADEAAVARRMEELIETRGRASVPAPPSG